MSYIDFSALGIMDKAVFETMTKHPDYSPRRISGAFKQYLKHYNDSNRADGFSRNNGARDNFNMLTKEDIYAELLKNIIKLDAYRSANGKVQNLSSKNDYFDAEYMSPLEQEKWLYNRISDFPIDVINFDLSHSDEMLSFLISSFVDSRYFYNYAPNETDIDDPMNLTEKDQMNMDKIDRYYKMGNVYGR